MNVKQVASRLGISRSLVYALCRMGVIRHTRHGRPGRRGCIRIEAADVDDYLAACRYKPPPEDGAPLRHIR